MKQKKCKNCGENECCCASIRRGMNDMKKGYTYLFSCTHEKDKSICFTCCSNECKRWYKLGKRDAKKR